MVYLCMAMNTQKHQTKFHRHPLGMIAVIMLLALLCQGCTEKSIPLASALSMDSEGNTGLGIHAGSTYDEWATAYGAFEVQVADGENYVPYTVDIPEERKETSEDTDPIPHDGRFMVAAFYIDDVPMSVKDIAEATGVGTDDLADYLASPEYLAEHTVVFRYMIFIIENDVVNNIACDYLDYNSEL